MTTTTDLGYQVAGAWKDCPHGGDNQAAGWWDCPVCQGTGHIYALPDSVRAPCDCGCHGWAGQGDNGPLNPACQGSKCPGWTPSTDLAVWAKAAYPIMEISKGYLGHSKLFEEYALACAKGDLETVQCVLAQVLVRGGWTLGGTP